MITVKTPLKTRFTDAPLIQTPRYYGQFALSLGKESPNIFFKFIPLNTDIFFSVRVNGFDFSMIFSVSFISNPRKSSRNMPIALSSRLFKPHEYQSKSGYWIEV